MYRVEIQELNNDNAKYILTPKEEAITEYLETHNCNNASACLALACQKFWGKEAYFQPDRHCPQYGQIMQKRKNKDTCLMELVHVNLIGLC